MFNFNDDSPSFDFMEWKVFTVPKVGCFVNEYELKCIDPDGNTFAFDSAGGTAGVSAFCENFRPSPTDLHKGTRNIFAAASSFSSSDSGIFTL